ncbi:uncharacterized protein LOC119765216 [Culex quinquefasciatus]|uniref:uncharacterized protein LOC119765216 n=1 Tax=Culex quinquefasciatus TaxID=7176 RepID=UPI0018E3785C|nr:uncharacterized protein LOC119765216 [Culex quinquefasciatus]
MPKNRSVFGRGLDDLAGPRARTCAIYVGLTSSDVGRMMLQLRLLVVSMTASAIRFSSACVGVENRYYDKERSKSFATRQASSNFGPHAHFRFVLNARSVRRKKANIMIKAPTAVMTKQPSSKATKKIEMGAATSFGK